jgi:UPF0042 nucleotide-binding protein
MKLVIISGLSGSGKSIALQALEDLGFNCIDNLPVGLLHSLAVQITHAADKTPQQFAVGIDARNLTTDFQQFPDMIDSLQGMGLETQVIYLLADDTTLIKRFSETRRKHPLSSELTPLNEAIRKERKLLEPLSSNADMAIDTSHTNVHQLRDLIRSRVLIEGNEGMSILLQSFGFKHGIPDDANFIFDVRCLSNPHWVPELRCITGKDQQVIEYLESHDDVLNMYEDIKNFLVRWIPNFESENRSYMTVAIGCTGGYHRSVYMAEKLAEHLRSLDKNVIVRHREIT